MSVTSTVSLNRRRRARVIAWLLQELDANRFDSPQTLKLLQVPGGQMHLLRAIALARAGYYARARKDVEACLSRCQGRPGFVWAAGIIFYVTRDYHRSLECLFQAAREGGASVILGEVSTYAGDLGWEEDSRRAVEAVLAKDPTNLWWHNQAVKMHVRGRNFGQALKHVEAFLVHDPGGINLYMQKARLLSELSRYREAAKALEVGLSLACDDPVARAREAAEVYMSIGAVGCARALLLEVQAAKPSSEVLVELGRLALWADEHDEVLRLASEAEKLDPTSAGVARLRGAVAVRKGDYTNAIVPLERAIAAAPGEFEAHVWRAEAALLLGDFSAVHKHLHDSSMKASGFLFVSWMLRFLAVCEEDNYSEGHLPAFRLEEFIKPVLELCPGCEPVLERRNERELVGLIERALARLGGNRTPMATSFDPETRTLTRLKTKSGARYSSRHALQLIRVMGPQQALAALDQVVEDFPQSSLPVCHRGELWLWMGNLERARIDLKRAIEILPQTRWAYIGLTGIDILEGNLEQALVTSAWGVETMGETEGPSVYIYRGEALRRLGRYDEALFDLTRSVQIHPSRVSAWLNLALLYAARSEIELFEKVYARLQIQAPGLLSDAAREVGEVLWGDPGFVPSVKARVAVIEHGLEMMRGNRSSTAMTYFTAEGNMRMVEHRDAATPVGRGPNCRDAAVLTRAHNVVMSSLGLGIKTVDEVAVDGEKERRILAWLPDVTPPPRQAYELSPDQIAEFERRGFITLKGCFSRELAKEWVDDACRRLAENPENWVSPGKLREVDPDRAKFDPEDSATWAWEKLSLPGPRLVSIEKFAPKAWGGICSLLGGAGRIRTSTCNDYFVINFRSSPDSIWTRDEGWQWRSEGWHLDDPSVATSLKAWSHGLIVMFLFSDVGPKGGGTSLVGDSPAKVARLLASADQGVDFVDSYDAVASVLRECQDFHDITGEVGDAILIHPLMLHASSVNISGKIRWMSNPLIFLHKPMNFDREDPEEFSVVERLVAEAINSADKSG